jgi:hypothetical protein
VRLGLRVALFPQMVVAEFVIGVAEALTFVGLVLVIVWARVPRVVLLAAAAPNRLIAEAGARG